MAEMKVEVDSVTSTSAMPTTPFKPTAANVLAGGTRVNNSVTQTTFLTVPAGRTWYGTVSVCATSGATVWSAQDARVVTAGTNVTPAAATVVAIATQGRDTGAAVATQQVYVVAPAGNSVTLDLLNSTATTFTGCASANGVLL